MRRVRLLFLSVLLGSLAMAPKLYAVSFDDCESFYFDCMDDCRSVGPPSPSCRLGCKVDFDNCMFQIGSNCTGPWCPI